MKKIKSIAIIALSALTICPLLNVSAEISENERSDISYSEIKYQEFDSSKLVAAAKELTEMQKRILKEKKAVLKN
jgi:hypothetical protein